MDRLLLLIHHRANRLLLSRFLANHYAVIETDDFNGTKQDCGLIIVDAVSLVRHQAEIARFKQQQTLFVPILLLTRTEDMGLAISQLWQTVDELITLPVKKNELLARVHSLFLTRALHIRVLPLQRCGCLARAAP